MKKIKALLLISFLLFISCATTQIKNIGRIKFTGETVTDKTSGLTIVGEEKQGIIAVTNIYHHYGMILPYSGEWVFSSDKKSVLTGNAGKLNVSLAILKVSDKPRDYLDGLMMRMLTSGVVPGLIDAEIVTDENEPILRTEVDVGKIPGSSFKGVRQVNFFAAKRWDELLYVFHLSRLVEESEMESFNEMKLLKMASIGFRVDFNR